MGSRKRGEMIELIATAEKDINNIVYEHLAMSTLCTETKCDKFKLHHSVHYRMTSWVTNLDNAISFNQVKHNA